MLPGKPAEVFNRPASVRKDTGMIDLAMGRKMNKIIS